MKKRTIRRERYSGILLHPTSLFGRSGIGDIGEPARRFVQFLAEAGQTLWQICPLGPTGFGDSPYASFSAFAGNPFLIALEPLVEEGLLERAELDAYPHFPEDHVDYGPVIEAKGAIVRAACSRLPERGRPPTRKAFGAFCKRHKGWLDDFALFMALKRSHGGAAWNTWEKPLAMREAGALNDAAKELAGEIDTIKAAQFLFFRQWAGIKKDANQRGIRIIGDVPIFVAFDSADVWAHRELFFLDAGGAPTVVAGVPPDYFSPTGQRWGNPLYRWKEMKKDGYAWWIARVKMALETMDVVRLDHFRGFDAYWEAPASEPTAVKGRWVKGPGEDFFNNLRDAIGSLPLIAEDLGVITPKVDALREKSGLPGMKVLQFAFGDDPLNPYLPHNHEKNCVVYTGTHDNDTTRGWYDHAGEKTRDHVRRYLWCDGNNIHLDMTRAALMSCANMAIITMQDVLGLNGDARLNKPGAAEGNWQWRMTEKQLNPFLASSLRSLTELYGRGELPPEKEDDGKTPDPDDAAEE